MVKLSEIYGICFPLELRLAQSGINSVDALLKQGSIRRGRKAISVKTGVSEQQVLDWVSRADLRRIANLSANQALLVEAAGVRCLPQLAQSQPGDLHRSITEFNSSENVCLEPPSRSQVEDWVSQARNMQHLVVY